MVREDQFCNKGKYKTMTSVGLHICTHLPNKRDKVVPVLHPKDLLVQSEKCKRSYSFPIRLHTVLSYLP